MDWDDLRFVLALSRHGSLSHAAASLGASHTTVGRRLRALEKKLGVRLFDSTPEGFVATAAGNDMREVAERLEHEVLSLEGRVLGRDAELNGKLRVTTMDLLLRHYRPHFASFIARYPSVELTVVTSDSELSLLRREADVALRLSNTPPENLIGRKLGQLEFAVYASRELAQRLGPEAHYADYPWVHWDERLDTRWLDSWLGEHAPKAKIALRVDASSLILREVVRAGLGVFFLACADADPDPELIRIGPIQPQFSRDIWLLTLPDLKHTSRVRAFLDHFTATSR